MAGCIGAESTTTTTVTTSSTDQDKEICKFYLDGKCRFGDDCFNSHPPGMEGKDSPKATQKKKAGKKVR